MKLDAHGYSRDLVAKHGGCSKCAKERESLVAETVAALAAYCARVNYDAEDAQKLSDDIADELSASVSTPPISDREEKRNG